MADTPLKPEKDLSKEAEKQISEAEKLAKVRRTSHTAHD